METHADVIVVGAGLAGLVTARRLAQAGRRVLVLEARDRVGGRTYSRTLASGVTVDLGGQWVGPDQPHITALLRELEIGTVPTPTSGKDLLLLGGERYAYEGKAPPLPLAVELDFGLAFARLSRESQQVPLDAPWRAPRAAEWDALTFESWIQANTHLQATADLFRLYAGAVFSADATDMSLLHVLFYTHAGGGVRGHTEVRGHALQDRVEGGAERVADRLAADLSGAVRLGCPVRAVQLEGSGVTVVSDGGTFRAERVVVALPTPLVSRLQVDPPLPPRRAQLQQRTPMGSVIKCHAVYERPFWRERGFSGQALSDHGAVRVIFDNSPADGSRGVLLGFIEGSEARAFGAVPAAERQAAVLACFAEYFGEWARFPLEYVDHDWATEEWTGGCYGTLYPPGAWTGYGESLRAPVGRLHWAGSDTATRWFAYMDGAVESGERAATEVLVALLTATPSV